TKARNLEDPGPLRYFASDEPGKEAIEKGGPGRRKQPRGGKVVRLPIGYDEIDRMFVVEMIDLEPICERGQVPFEKIDEDALARLEHGAKRAVRMRSVRGIDNQQHERPPS